MTRWRRRIGPERLEALPAETIAAAIRSGAMAESHARRVTVDTAVQSKAVAHPTDSHLLHRGVQWLNRLARRHGGWRCASPSSASPPTPDARRRG
jgi:transposase, IS5 family